MKTLDLHGVTKRYGSATVIDGCSLSVPAGETTVLIGPSGCGKSTLLKLINGLCRPDEGEVLVEGRKVEPPWFPELRRGIGYVIQDGGLFPHLSAADNVTLMARHLGWERARIASRVGELTRLTRLPAASLSRRPAALSGGQQQRVALMRALMLDPGILLLDEPLGALDPMIRFELQQDLRDIFRALGKTVVLVTHDLSEAGFFGDRIVLLRHGRIVQQGSLEDLRDAPAEEFVTRFVRAQRGHSR